MGYPSEIARPTVHDGLAVYEHGHGDPVLVMPGPHRFERPGVRSADALLEGLAQLGHRVITFDPPGSGASTRPAQLGMAEMHRCADESLAACGDMGPVDAVGHSMGGLAVLAYVLARPTRIRRLVLIGTGSGGPAYMKAPGALWNRTHPDFWGMVGLAIVQMVIHTRGPERLLNAYIGRRSFHDPRHVEPGDVRLGDWLAPREGRTDWHRIARRLDYRLHLHTIRTPTLVLCGRHDPQFPPACSEELAAAIPHAELVWLADSGHFPYIEEPDVFWRAVARFLDVPTHSSCPDKFE